MVSTIVSTDMPGRSRAANGWSGSIAIRTAMRWATFTKLPVALSAFSTANSEPAAGANCSTRPVSSARSSASTLKRTGWPGAIAAVCASL